MQKRHVVRRVERPYKVSLIHCLASLHDMLGVTIYLQIVIDRDAFEALREIMDVEGLDEHGITGQMIVIAFIHREQNHGWNGDRCIPLCAQCR